MRIRNLKVIFSYIWSSRTATRKVRGIEEEERGWEEKKETRREEEGGRRKLGYAVSLSGRAALHRATFLHSAVTSNLASIFIHLCFPSLCEHL